jgi:hypothetical protein
LLKRYGLKEGASVVFQEDRGLVLEPGKYAAIYALQGGLRAFCSKQDLAKQRKAEQKRENRG